jgi:quercetin dioxygenase-like cupin family protein
MATAQKKALGGTGAGHKAIEGTLDRPLLEFDLNAEREKLHQDEAWGQPTGRSSRTLVKHADLRIVLIGMKANTQMHEHMAAGRISVQTLSGHIRLQLPDQAVDLPAGHLLALDQCVPHDVEALEESEFLLTLSWPPRPTIQGRKSRPHKKVRHDKK